MGKHTTDLLQRRVKLGAAMDVLLHQLAELHQELRQVHGGIMKALSEKVPRVSDINIPNVISNFPRIMERRLEMAIEDRPSPSGQSFEEVFSTENAVIAARLEAPAKPVETYLDLCKRLGMRVETSKS